MPISKKEFHALEFMRDHAQAIIKIIGEGSFNNKEIFAVLYHLKRILEILKDVPADPAKQAISTASRALCPQIAWGKDARLLRNGLTHAYFKINPANLLEFCKTFVVALEQQTSQWIICEEKREPVQGIIPNHAIKSLRLFADVKDYRSLCQADPHRAGGLYIHARGIVELGNDMQVCVELLPNLIKKGVALEGAENDAAQYAMERYGEICNALVARQGLEAGAKTLLDLTNGFKGIQAMVAKNYRDSGAHYQEEENKITTKILRQCAQSFNRIFNYLRLEIAKLDPQQAGLIPVFEALIKLQENKEAAEKTAIEAKSRRDEGGGSAPKKTRQGALSSSSSAALLAASKEPKEDDDSPDKAGPASGTSLSNASGDSA